MTMSARLESMSSVLELPSIQGLSTWASTPAASLRSSSPLLMSAKVLTTRPPPCSSRNLERNKYKVDFHRQHYLNAHSHLMMPSSTQQMEPSAWSAEILVSSAASRALHRARRLSTAP